MARASHVIPGLPLTLGYTLFYLSLLVLLPLAALVVKTTQLTWSEFYGTMVDPVVVAAFRLTLGAAILAAAINGIFGLIVAWVLVREPFFGRRLFDALIDFPFALPTAVAGITFSTLYLKDGWIGGFGDHLVAGANFLAGRVGHPHLFPTGALSFLDFPFSNTNVGIVIVLVFVGLPFVVRTVQPVLQEWDPEYEQAAHSLGANGFDNLSPRHLSGDLSRMAERHRPRLRPRHRRIRVGHFHRQQYSRQIADRAAADRHQA